MVYLSHCLCVSVGVGCSSWYRKCPRTDISLIYDTLTNRKTGYYTNMKVQNVQLVLFITCTPGSFETHHVNVTS